MTHEWRFDITDEYGRVTCRFVCKNPEHPDCEATLEGEEVLKRLNATEELSAEDAETASNLYKDTNSNEARIKRALRAYSAAMEGENA